MPGIESVRHLTELLLPDPRHSHLGNLPEKQYARLAEIKLNEAAPQDVRQLFETAKNLSLYSWFVYRFHPVASFIAYSCLEAALRPLALADPTFPKQVRPNWFPKFGDMMNHAVSKGWLTNRGFDNARHMAKARARHRALIEQIQEMNAQGIDEMESREPTIEAIEAELATLPYARNLAKNIPDLRNVVAHGHRFLDGGSISVISLVAEAINQLYPAVKSDGQATAI
jgi:hypothetical protein